MNRLSKIKYIIMAVGILISAAFYMHEYESSSDDTVFFGGREENTDAAADDGNGAEPETAVEGNFGSSPGLIAGSSTETESKLREIINEELAKTVKEAVREELYSICEEGYLEKALNEAAELARNEADKKAGMININSADKSELTSLEGIGEKRAEDIIEYRNINGGFESTDELMNVKGIKQTLFDRIKDKIYV